MEMHTVHVADEIKNNFLYSAVGLFFSVNDYTRKMEDWEQEIIDRFFESFKWDTVTGVIKPTEVAYGELMMMADMDNRWTYRGSVTTPPCAQNVYWNVLRTVYPIKEEVLTNFKKQLHRKNGLCPWVGNLNNQIPTVCVPGNNRLIQATHPDHLPFIISNGADLTKTVRSQVLPVESVAQQDALLRIADAAAAKADVAVAKVAADAAADAAVAKVTADAALLAATDSSSEYLTTVITVLLIIAILFLLLAVIIVTKNSFNKSVQYNNVETGTLATDRQAEGG